MDLMAFSEAFSLLLNVVAHLKCHLMARCSHVCEEQSLRWCGAPWRRGLSGCLLAGAAVCGPRHLTEPHWWWAGAASVLHHSGEQARSKCGDLFE